MIDANRLRNVKLIRRRISDSRESPALLYFITRSWLIARAALSLLHGEICTIENGTIGAVEISMKSGEILSGSFCLKKKKKKIKKQSTARLNLGMEYRLLRD